MSLHKLTAGDGYTYLTRQVAAHDATDKGHVGLADYYAAKGESPGVWVGAGLADLDGVGVGDPVTAEQMKALFGQGRHPDAAEIERRALAQGRRPEFARAQSRLGAAFAVYAAQGSFRVEVAERFTAFNLARGERWNAAIPAADK